MGSFIFRWNEAKVNFVCLTNSYSSFDDVLTELQQVSVAPLDFNLNLLWSPIKLIEVLDGPRLSELSLLANDKVALSV
jgi:hypothetical protein